MRLVVAIILLVAAMLKAYQLATTPSLGEGLLHARWFNIFVVEFELFFGIWLFFGMLPRLTWIATTGLFATFFGVTFYEAVTGKISCNCFGNFSLNPWITMIFDLFIIVLLVYFRPNKSNIEKWKGIFSQYYRQFILFIGIYVLLGSVVYGWIIQRTYERLEYIGQVLESNVVQIEPGLWIGKEFPLRDYVVNGQEILRGKWILLFSRPGCNDCKTIKTKLLENEDQNTMLAFLDTTAMVTNNSKINTKNFRLALEINWVVETPIIVELSEGIVQDVQTREQLLLSKKN
jgi:hypothetical protein